jgi:YidC/Oxa1 family membrane protein insertase
MDRKTIIILAAAFAVLLLMSPVVDHFFPPKPVPVASPVFPTNTPVAEGIVAPTAALAPIEAQSTIAARFLTASNEDLIWHFTSDGGGLAGVDLVKYPAVIKRPTAESGPALPAALNVNAPSPVLSLPGLQGNNDFTLAQTGQTVRAEKTLTNGLRLIKEFELGSNCFFKARVSLENTTSKPLTVPAHELIVGTATAASALDDPTAIGTIWYNGIKSQNIKAAWYANRTLGCIPGVPKTEYEEGASNVVWAASHNQFFVLAAIPSNPAPRLVIDKIVVPSPDLRGPTNSMSVLLTNGYQAGFEYPPAVLPPGQSSRIDLTFYAGPKEYNRLAQMGQTMNNNLDLIMDFTGPMGFFSKVMLLSMNALHSLGFQYGLTVIALTVILKLVFWPLTKASIRSQKAMQALQPQLKVIADKYKDDPLKKHQKTTEFLKEHKVSQLGSCLPTLLQLPVFWGFYLMLKNAIELRGAHFLWINDLSQPDTVARIAGFPVNPLPLIMGATQLWQAQMTPPAPGMDPGQQKIMRFMPLIFIAFFYQMPAGLTLYWTVQNLLSIVQMRLTKNIGAAVPVPAPGAVKKRK